MWQIIGKIDEFHTYPASNLCKFLAMCMTMVVMAQISGFMFWFPYIQPLYYLFIVLISFYILGDRIYLDGRVLAFLIILCINAFLLPTDPVFESKARYGLFLMVMIVCSPMIKTKRAIILRQYMFKYIMLSMIPLVVGSFFCFFLGINLMPYNIRNVANINVFGEYESQGGLFSGLFDHSMTMGPVSVLVAIIFFIAYQKYSKKIFMVIFFCSAFAVVMAASRAALLSLIVSLFYIIFIAVNTSKYKKRIIGLLLVSILFSAPFAERAFTGIVNKQKDRLEYNDGKLNSRDNKFQARLNEFYDSPLWGIGFATIDERYDFQYNGQIEPGTSHLAVLSMSGIIGLVAYIIILLYAFNKVRRSNDFRALMLLGLLIAFFVHLWFEGYVFGAGSALCFMFWLVISQCFDYKFTA